LSVSAGATEGTASPLPVRLTVAALPVTAMRRPSPSRSRVAAAGDADHRAIASDEGCGFPVPATVTVVALPPLTVGHPCPRTMTVSLLPVNRHRIARPGDADRVAAPTDE